MGEAGGQSGSGRREKGRLARAVLSRGEGGPWGPAGCPLCWSCSRRTRRSRWARPHTTCPAWWPLPIHTAGLPRPLACFSQRSESLAQKAVLFPGGLQSASQFCSEQEESRFLCFTVSVSVSLSLGHTSKACWDAAVPRQPCPQDWHLGPPETSHLLPQLSPTPLGKRCAGGHGWQCRLLWLALARGRGWGGSQPGSDSGESLEGLGMSQGQKEAPCPA